MAKAETKDLKKSLLELSQEVKSLEEEIEAFAGGHVLDEFQDDLEVLNKFFDDSDQDNDGKLSMQNIDFAFAKYKAKPEVQLHDVKRFTDELRNYCSGEGFISKKTFLENVEKFPHLHGQRVEWVRGLRLETLLARQIPVGALYDELSGLRDMEQEEFDAGFARFCNQAKIAFEREWRKLKEVKPKGDDTLIATDSKFAFNVGIFGDTQMFQEGLAAQLGSADPFILKGIIRDNVLAKGAKERSITSNYKIPFSDYQEYARILGNPAEYGNKNIPIFLLEIARHKHKGIEGPSEAELKELEPEFTKLREYNTKMRNSHFGVFPGDVGHVQKTIEIELKVSNEKSAQLLQQKLCEECKKIDEDSVVGFWLDASTKPLGPTVKFTIYFPPASQGLTKETIIEILGSREDDVLKQSYCVYVYCKNPTNKTAFKDLLLERFPLNKSDVSLKRLCQIFNLSDDSQSQCNSDQQLRDYMDHLVHVSQEGAHDGETPSIVLMQGRKHLSLRDLMNLEPVRKAGLRVEEALQAHAYTGPLFQRWNGVLRKMPFSGTAASIRKKMKDNDPTANTEEVQTTEEAQQNHYATSIHVLVSATLKLLRKGRIPSSRKTYRGLGTMKLGQEWYEEDVRGTRCGVELGFMSTTTSLQVAQEYSGVKVAGMGTVFEFDLGAIDCGADLSSLSQYPGESELLFPPLSHLEVLGRPKVVKFKNGGDVIVITIKVNINEKAMTIEEMLSERQRSLQAIRENLVKEISFDVNLVKEISKSDDELILTRDCDLKPLLTENQRLAKLNSMWFNKDDNFIAALNEVFKQKQNMISTFVKDNLQPTAQEKRMKLLLDALGRGKSEIAQALIELGTSVDDTLKGEAIGLAAEGGDIECIELALTKLEAKANTVDKTGQFAIVRAAASGQVECLSLLVDNKADLESKNKDGRTAIIAAAWNGEAECVRALVELKADVESKDQEGRTAIIAAACNGEAECVRALFKLNAKVDPADKYGRTAIIAAASCDDECVRALVELKADVESKDKYDRTSVIWAASEGKVECVRALVELKADVESKDKYDRTSVIWAASEGKVECVRALVELKADVESKDKYGKTAIIAAACNGEAECVRALVELKANVNSKDKEGRAAITWAEYNNEVECVQALVELKANIESKVQDPYIKAVLHHGQDDDGDCQSVRTTTKENAGEAAIFNEYFEFDKPAKFGVLRVELWDDNVLQDDLLGSLDVCIDSIFAEQECWGSYIQKKLSLLKNGEETAIVDIKVKMKILA